MTLRESLDIVRARDARKNASREAVLARHSSSVMPFAELLAARGLPALTRGESTTLQLNVGKLCNLACRHCHVEAGPTRKLENMDRRTAERCVELMRSSASTVRTVDLTGGAPELNPNFRYLVESARALGLEVIDRCNLSVLFEPGQEDTAEFLARHKVRIIASLPGTDDLKVDKQRGKGAWSKSVEGIRRLNALGYGRDPSLRLDLIYNPDGAQLPGAQDVLEAEFKHSLLESNGLHFTGLLTITNMPVKRFADELVKCGQYEGYMNLLAVAFNPATLPAVMCRSTVSVSWDGSLFDCDFNQQLDKAITSGAGANGDAMRRPLTVWDVQDVASLAGRPVSTHKGCYGCTAGAGSSCGGSLL
jgi:radical SAM/Cys-rich protein